MLKPAHAFAPDSVEATWKLLNEHLAFCKVAEFLLGM